MKILKTNWINVVGVFSVVLIYSIITNLFSNTTSSLNFFQSVIAALILVCLYGVLLWLLFIGSLIILDLLLIIRSQKELKLKLLIEWLIISLPFIYWSIIHERQRWVYLVAVITFLITQLLRERIINKTT
jgi:hypothetical protein